MQSPLCYIENKKLSDSGIKRFENLSSFDIELLRLVCLFPEGVNLPYLFKKISNSNKSVFKANSFQSLRMKVYRKIKRFKRLNLLKVEKIDGLIWIFATKSVVDLIRRKSKTQTSFKKRDLASLVLNKRKYLTPKDKAYISRLFLEYLEEIDSKFIVLEAKEDFKPLVLPTYLVKRFETRFNSRRRISLIKRKYRGIWEICKSFKVGVFLTLTSDPKRFSCLNDMYKAVSVGFNRFLSLLRRRFGFRPKYICVQEFSEKGFLHLHIVFFGIHRLMDKYEITEFWKKYGIGEINFVYKIVNRGGSFVWAKNPKRIKEKSVDKYLFKYLTKTFRLIYDLEEFKEDSEIFKLALYWATNKRFFTRSYSLVPISFRFKLNLYRFYGVFDLDGIFWFILSDAIFLGDDFG